VLGVDPGTRVVGWAVLEPQVQGVWRVASGVWRLGGSEIALPQRLHRLCSALSETLRAHAPARVALEAAFFGRNARSALRIGEARGVVMMAAAAAGLPVEEIPPATVKRRVTGAGAATKEQVERLVRVHLGQPDLQFDSADESDAIAVALCSLLAMSGPLPARRGRAALPAGARIQA
jgi:crossover junction endodeoxyribonuclease RuvC